MIDFCFVLLFSFYFSIFESDLQMCNTPKKKRKKQQLNKIIAKMKHLNKKFGEKNFNKNNGTKI